MPPTPDRTANRTPDRAAASRRAADQRAVDASMAQLTLMSAQGEPCTWGRPTWEARLRAAARVNRLDELEAVMTGKDARHLLRQYDTDGTVILDLTLSETAPERGAVLGTVARVLRRDGRALAFAVQTATPTPELAAALNLDAAWLRRFSGGGEVVGDARLLTLARPERFDGREVAALVAMTRGARTAYAWQWSALLLHPALTGDTLALAVEDACTTPRWGAALARRSDVEPDDLRRLLRAHPTAVAYAARLSEILDAVLDDADAAGVAVDPDVLRHPGLSPSQRREVFTWLAARTADADVGRLIGALSSTADPDTLNAVLHCVRTRRIDLYTNSTARLGGLVIRSGAVFAAPP